MIYENLFTQPHFSKAHSSLIDLSEDTHPPEGASYKYYEVAIIGAN